MFGCDTLSAYYIKASPDQPWISFTREGLYLVIQGALCLFASYLTSPRPHGFITCTYFLPMLARVYAMPDIIQQLHNVASKFSLVFMILYLVEFAPSALNIFWMEIRLLISQGQMVGHLYVFMSVCSKHKVTLQLFVFWVILFLHKVCTLVYAGKISDMLSHGLLLSMMICVAECCRSPVSVMGLSAMVSYVSMFVLTGTKYILQSDSEPVGGFNVALDGWVEGITMCLLAIQTGLTSLKTAHKAIVLSIVLFVVLTSLIQSLYELCDPILLNLCASQNKSARKHIKTLFVFTMLWMLPIVMTAYVLKFFQIDFWLLVIVSSALLTTVQVLGSLLIYGLFMYDMFSSNSIETLDDIVYYIKATVRVLEFMVALGVVLHGVYGSIFGEWSWFNSSVIIIHGYFNVWKRLQSGWRTFLLRRQATQKLDSLERASQEQLEDLKDDVCAICYQEFNSAHITECNHYFHATCLRKWLYVQGFCPICHTKI